MEYICIIIITCILSITLAIILKINVKKVKKIATNEELNNLVEKYPNNIEICKDILKKLNNETVTIEENKEAENCLYIAITNKILIADTKKSFTRIQTITHECIHSVQDRRILLFNFIYSNIYLLYFFAILILGIFDKLPNKMMFLAIFILLGLIHFVVRAYLENDAMIKAKYLAKEYMEEAKISTKEEIHKIVEGLENLNNEGIKGVNFSLVLDVLIKTIILSLIFVIQ